MAAPPPQQQQEEARTGQEETAGKVDRNQDGAVITLYWLEKSRSQRILWLLEELHLTYTLKTFKRQQKLAPPELKKIHPLGKSPIVTISFPDNNKDDDDDGSKDLVLAESSFIIEYLIEHYGGWMVPPKWKAGMEGKVGGETEGWLRYRYYMHYAEGSLMPYLVIGVIMSAINTTTPYLIKPLTRLITSAVDTKFLLPNLKSNFAFLESQLASSPSPSPSSNDTYLTGPTLTGADIVMSFPLAAARGKAGFIAEAYPLLWAYVDRLEGREGYKRAVEKIVEIEGGYDASL